MGKTNTVLVKPDPRLELISQGNYSNIYCDALCALQGLKAKSNDIPANFKTLSYGVPSSIASTKITYVTKKNCIFY